MSYKEWFCSTEGPGGFVKVLFFCSCKCFKQICRLYSSLSERNSAEHNGNYPKRLPSRSLFGEKIKRVQLTFSYLAMPINFKYVQFQDILPPV